jgi:hypothetical protein
MQQPGLDQRHRDKDGTIGRTHGNTRIGTLRGPYGQDFADEIADIDKLGDVLHRMAGAYFVRVSADPSPNTLRTFEIWIVATDDAAEAEQAVREMVSPTRTVDVIYDRPSEETIKRLALPPGKAWLL